MILRSLSPPPAASQMEPVWTAVERSQKQDFSGGCWLIPQPSHAALAGDIAAALNDQFFPGLTPEVVRAIALHDAGWSPDDAAVIQDSRAKGAKARPYPFLAAPPQDTVAAWTGSIEIAGKAAPIGGYLVSRHFAAIGENYRAQSDAKTVAILDRFLQQEKIRQQSLRNKLTQPDAQLDSLLTALQFCDLLSLYISCGISGDVEFPQTLAGQPIRLQRQGTATLTPFPFNKEASFSIAGLRHPRTPPDSSQTFTLTFQTESQNG